MQPENNTNVKLSIEGTNEKQNSVNADYKYLLKKIKALYILIPVISVIAMVISITATYFMLADRNTVTIDSSATENSETEETENNTDTYVNTKCSVSATGNHLWAPPTCIEPSKCEYCYEYKNDKLGNHHFVFTEDGEDMCEFCYELYDWS